MWSKQDPIPLVGSLSVKSPQDTAELECFSSPFSAATQAVG